MFCLLILPAWERSPSWTDALLLLQPMGMHLARMQTRAQFLYLPAQLRRSYQVCPLLQHISLESAWRFHQRVKALMHCP